MGNSTREGSQDSRAAGIQDGFQQKEFKAETAQQHGRQDGCRPQAIKPRVSSVKNQFHQFHSVSISSPLVFDQFQISC